MSLKTVESKRGRPVLLYSGFKYHHRKVYRNSDDIFWTCVNRKCRGTVSTNAKLTKVLCTREHSKCVPNDVKNYVEECLFRAKKRARKECTPIPRIFREEVASRGLGAVPEIPNFSSVKQKLYHARNTSRSKNVIGN